MGLFGWNAVPPDAKEVLTVEQWFVDVILQSFPSPAPPSDCSAHGNLYYGL